MKTWAWISAAICTTVVVACGGSNSGTTGAGGSSTASGTGGAAASSSSGMMDAVCTDPNALTQACVTCIGGLANTTACVQAFITACQGTPACNAFGSCQSACVKSAHDAGITGAGGGGTACVAGQNTGDAGTPEDNCFACCTNGNVTGANDFYGGLITSCACTTGAPCAAGCK